MSLLNAGVQSRLIQESPTGPGMTEKSVSVQTDSVLVTLYANSVSATLAVTVYAVAEVGQETELFSFPVLTSGTTDLLLKRAAVTTSHIVVRATYTGSCEYTVHARAINGGITNSKITGAEHLVTSQISVSTVPTKIVLATLVDRSGILIKNWSVGVDVYVGESDTRMYYPLSGRDALSIDLAAGQEIWAYTLSGSADLRIAQVGG